MLLSKWLRRFSVDLADRAVDKTDVLIIGAGPAGLSAAIKLKQLDSNVRVIVLEKGGEVGAHILSGAAFEPRALNELMPNWKELDAPIKTSVTHDRMSFLTSTGSYRIPHPPQMNNKGNYIVSLSNVVKWLGQQAEALGVEIYPGIAGRNLVIENGTVKGVVTNDVGVSKSGEHKSSYEKGMYIEARQTLLAEGCHGSLAKHAIGEFNLRPNSFQTYGLGLKEVWEIRPDNHSLGKVEHSIGWPLDSKTYGGSFLYHAEDNKVYLGFVVGLDYTNPYLSPYREFQKWKTHPYVKKVLEGGKCLAYGARALNEGGVQSLPKLSAPGLMLLGCSAGFLNVPKIKGSHTAMKSGIVAAECIVESLKTGDAEVTSYEEAIKSSWLYKELYEVRNIRPSFKYGMLPGIIYSGLDSVLLRGKVPFTLKHHAPDHTTLKPEAECKPIDYPKPDGEYTFSLLDNLARSNTNHEEDQPSHLTLKDKAVPLTVNYPVYGGPEGRYCPAGVYEYLKDSDSANSEDVKFQINAQNCLHCKTCDIKDPTQNINWVPPEGGGGPQYIGT